MGIIRSSPGFIERCTVKTAIDFSNLPVVDAHCHSYLPTPKILTADEFGRHASLAVQPDFLAGKSAPSESQIQNSRNRLLEMYRKQPFFVYMIRSLSTFLRCETDLETVVKARNTRARDLDTYVKDLFADALIRGLVIDCGYPPTAEEDLKRIPAKSVKIFRLETFIKDLLDRHSSFSELCSAYESGIREAVKGEKHVALKSIIAYRSGLKIGPAEPEGAKRDFLDIKEGRAETGWFGPKAKKFRDFLFVKALEISIDLDVPMQVHTGVGDHDIILDQCDPSLMYDLLKDEYLRHATVVLVHSGFPNSQNAAYMASVLPNVFLDFSLVIPFLNPVGHERMIETLQLAPSSKIMYGSDGFNLPELIWLGAKAGKRTLGKCLHTLVQEGLFDENEANLIAKRILFDNANKLYGLELT